MRRSRESRRSSSVASGGSYRPTSSFIQLNCHNVLPIQLKVPVNVTPPAHIRFAAGADTLQIPKDTLIYKEATNEVVTASGKVVPLECLHAQQSTLLSPQAQRSSPVSAESESTSSSSEPAIFSTPSESGAIKRSGTDISSFVDDTSPPRSLAEGHFSRISSIGSASPFRDLSHLKDELHTDSSMGELSDHDITSVDSDRKKSPVVPVAEDCTDYNFYWHPAKAVFIRFALPNDTVVIDLEAPERPRTPVDVRGPPLPRAAEWLSWPEVRVRIMGIPLEWTLLKLYTALRDLNLGNIYMIDLPESNKRVKGFARVGFRPAPLVDFWSYGRPFYVKDGAILAAQLDVPRDTFYVSSPSDQHMYCLYLQTFSGRTLSIGFLEAQDVLNVRFKSYQAANVSLEINLDRMAFKVHFQIVSIISKQPSLIDTDEPDKVKKLYRRYHSYSFEVKFEQLKDVRYSKGANPTMGSYARKLSFEIDGSPPLYKREDDIKKILTMDGPETRYFVENYCWSRVTSIPFDPTYPAVMAAPLSTHVDTEIMDLAHWNTYMIDFSLSKYDAERLDYLFKFLRLSGIEMKREPLRVVNTPCTKVWQWLDNTALPYAVLYQLEVCISHNWLHEAALTNEFISHLSKLPDDEAVGILEKVADDQKRVWDPMSIFNISRRSNLIAEYPNYCSPMRKAQITPTSIILSTPMVDITNRVIRQYVHLSDRFIRVQFSDENAWGKLGGGNDFDASANLYDRVYRALKFGFQIGNRHYEYLASGNSQIRDHGAWFYASDGFVTVDDIRDWMGRFNDIKNIAKNAARLGQCFSTTRALRTTKPEIEIIPDIKRNNFCFTDGIGKMSPGVAQIIASEILQQPTSPAAVQFRLGGYKGMLALWPDVPGFKVQLRESQLKFESTHLTLEIVRCSSLASSRLNRQIIAVLSTLGVPDEVFLARQANMLGYLNRVTRDEESALYLLTKNGDENGMNFALAEMIRAGFMKSDTFVENVLRLYQSYSIRMLKQKARIWIEEGAFLMGVCDEYGILKGHTSVEEDQAKQNRPFNTSALPEVFVQITDPRDATGHTKTVITGICLLARNPSLHPGDIRVVHAVDKPELRHLFDVVILPVTGSRDVANMASGGDLDGDDYTIIWDQQLIPQIMNYPPMDYTPPAPRMKEGEGEVTVDDRRQFMIDYMRNDQLGVIALSHLAIQDASPYGVMDPACLDLAQLHSMAVDFAKTGVPARIPKRLRAMEYPHYMERKRGRMRRSYKVLGKLYDAVQDVVFKPDIGEKFDSRLFDSEYVSDDRELRQLVDNIKRDYDYKVFRMMQQRGIESEFEVFTAYVLKYDSAGHNKDYKYWEEVTQQFTAISDMIKKKVYDAIGYNNPALSTKERDLRLRKFVVTAYVVCFEELKEVKQQGRVERRRRRLEIQKAQAQEVDLLQLDDEPAQEEPSDPAPCEDASGDGEDNIASSVFISFPWIFRNVLCAVARSVTIARGQSVDGSSSADPGMAINATGLATVEPIQVPAETNMIDITSVTRKNRNKLMTTSMMKNALLDSGGTGAVAPPSPWSRSGVAPFSTARGRAKPSPTGVSEVQLAALNLPPELTSDSIEELFGILDRDDHSNHGERYKYLGELKSAMGKTNDEDEIQRR
ncbi:RNA dependent RNA polymerase-domain-containing protein [Lipomyces tetrasporus]|uniref:RNA dependent RNA polymerase-domain-containing protein n=1 Tax=Lipomyces tetrasporus TaxID=54092 RepID=A0AAD7VW11_9ASCO|nr:RNA dependent RNA polymerase-domain-containing protein [Lipomyces tetrasporus]KAJ8102850.1 RNA dependent RNA polymerase-domain-containing protein [Lipomyces tetrasporus]